MLDPPYLFVYGTLRRGTGTQWVRFLEGASRFISPARARGALFHLGRYPGMVLCDDDSWVRGEVCLLTSPAASVAELDAYEGSAFERRVLDVLLDDGRTIRAWAYLYALETTGTPRIASGDFLDRSGSS